MRPRTVKQAVIVGAMGAWLTAASASAQPASGPGAAGAQVGPGGASAAPRDVREIYKQAVLSFQAGKFQQAYDGFKEVWATDKKPKVAGNLGRSALKLKKHCEAVEYLDLYLAQEKKLSQDEVSEVQRMVAEAKGQLVKLSVEVAAGAEVSIDGQTAGTAPLPHEICVDPGHHTLEARQGATTTRKDVQALPGAAQKVTLELTATSPPPPPPPIEPKTRSKAPAIVLGGVGAAGIIAGAVSLGVYSAKRDEALALRKTIEDENRRCPKGTPTEPPDCVNLHATAQEGDVFRVAGPILLGSGVALAAAAGAYLLWWPVSGPPKGDSGGAAAARLNVMATPEGGAVSISGRF